MARGLVRRPMVRIPCFRHFVWIRQPADGDSVISIEYYSELLNHFSENWEVLALRKYTDYSSNRKKSYWYIFVASGLLNFLIRGLVTLNNILSISHSPFPFAAGPIRNAENIEPLLPMV